MGVALGWVAAALAAAGAGSPPDEAAKPEITYRIRSVAVRGLDWRQAGAGLKSVAQHNAVSVWTSPDDFLDRLAGADTAVGVAPVAVKGKAQSPVHITTRKNQEFVTQVVWKGKDKAPRPVTEKVRAGLAATIVGRKLDQGVLAQVVIDDVDVRGVHTISSPADKKAVAHVHADCDKPAAVTVTVSASMDVDPKTDADAVKANHQPSKAVAILAQCKEKDKEKSPCCQADSAPAAKTDKATGRASWTPADPQVQIPEVGRAAAAGEWLIPDGEVLVIAFGPHTVADADGKAVVREHLAVISAEVADDDTPAPPQAGIAPEDAHPATTDRPEVPRTAAALPELPSRTLPQGVHVDGTPAPLPTLPDDEEPAAAADDASSEPLASPQSRRKTKPAAKPTIPAPDNEQEAAPAPASVPAAPAIETPTPQPPERPATEAVKTDAKAIKSSFRLPSIKGLEALQPLNSLVGSNVFPIPFQGAQFLMPLKALAVKLPFNQKLEFELIGRIVSDPEAADARFVVGN